MKASKRELFGWVSVGILWFTGCQQPNANKAIEQLPEPFLISWAPTTQPATLILPTQNNETAVKKMSKWIPRGGLSDRWNCIVVHHTASAIGCLRDIDRWHREKGWDCCGYHFVIGNGTGSGDGEIEVGPRWSDQSTGAHTRLFGAPSTHEGNYYNEHGIGIVLVGNFDKAPPTRKQMESLAELVHFLTAECQLPSDQIYVHGDLKSTDCPGLFFPRLGLAARLRTLYQDHEG